MHVVDLCAAAEGCCGGLARSRLGCVLVARRHNVTQQSCRKWAGCVLCGLSTCSRSCKSKQNQRQQRITMAVHPRTTRILLCIAVVYTCAAYCTASATEQHDQWHLSQQDHGDTQQTLRLVANVTADASTAGSGHAAAVPATRTAELSFAGTLADGAVHLNLYSTARCVFLLCLCPPPLSYT